MTPKEITVLKTLYWKEQENRRLSFGAPNNIGLLKKLLLEDYVTYVGPTEKAEEEFALTEKGRNIITMMLL